MMRKVADELSEVVILKCIGSRIRPAESADVRLPIMDDTLQGGIHTTEFGQNTRRRQKLFFPVL